MSLVEHFHNLESLKFDPLNFDKFEKIPWSKCEKKNPFLIIIIF